jgi:hypothetical protein
VRNYNLSKYEELKQKYNDDSNTLYWNNKNLMVTEKYVYIYKIKYDFEDIIKIDTQDNILRPFIRLRVFGKLIPQSITHYIITLKNGCVINVDDFPDYYKGKIKELDSLIWICKKSKYIERGVDSHE